MEAEVFERLAAHETDHWWFRARRRILREIIARHAPAGRPMEILEAGCGTGGNLPMLTQFGEVAAFELDAGACRHARSRGFPVEEGALPQAHPFTERRFDLIVLLDVLEHVHEDEASLAALARLLKPQGVLVITVPAFPWLWSSHDTVHHHFRRYTKPVLSSRLGQAGLRAERLGYFNFWLFPPIAAVRLVKKAIHSKTSDDIRVPPAPFNTLLRIIFSSERFLLRRGGFPFGMSLLAVARRKEA